MSLPVLVWTRLMGARRVGSEAPEKP